MLLDELATYDPLDPTRGLGWVVPQLAEAITELAGRWGVPPSGVAGWQKMRRLLADAGKPDVPGLYVSRACRFWWETVPLLARDPRRPEDVDSRGPDHPADATRYGVLDSGNLVRVEHLRI